MWFLAVFPLLVIDQWSKFWVLRELAVGQSAAWLPGINFHLSFNHGVAFSLFNKQQALGQGILLGVIILISVAVAWALVKNPREDKITALALTLVLGGALGNLFDRIYHGYVVDFIDFYIQHWHWYTFNIADSFITVGAILLLFKALFSKEQEQE